MPNIDPPYIVNIVADIQGQIARGELKPGDDLPSLSQLQQHYGVGLSTVRLALDRLKGAGVLVGHQGIAVRVADRLTP